MTSPGKKITVFKACQRDHHHGFRSWSTPVGGGGVHYFMNRPAIPTIEGTPLFAFDSEENAWNFIGSNSDMSSVDGLRVTVLASIAELSEIKLLSGIRSLYHPHEYREFWSLIRRADLEGVAVMFEGLKFPIPKGTVLCYKITPYRECTVPSELQRLARWHVDLLMRTT